MNWKHLIVIVPILLSFVGFYVMINYIAQQQNYSKYVKTISELTAWVNRFASDPRSPLPNLDAWGRPFIITKNEEQMVVMSQGADAIGTNDDIVLTINIRSGAYTVNYSFDSKHYFSGVYY